MRLLSYDHIIVNTLRPRQNGSHFADDIFNCIFLNELLSQKTTLEKYSSQFNPTFWLIERFSFLNIGACLCISIKMSVFWMSRIHLRWVLWGSANMTIEIQTESTVQILRLKQNANAYHYEIVFVLFGENQHSVLYWIFHLLNCRNAVDQNTWNRRRIVIFVASSTDK